MSIQINRSAQFDSFVDFAQQSITAGKSKAVARSGDMMTGMDGLASRTIKPATTDRAFALFRSRSDKTANDLARDLFRQSVRDMFGGESKIPPSVKEAMLLKDYEVGKPLTARRIMAVKEAIDKEVNPVHAEVSRELALATVTHSLQFIATQHAAASLPVVSLTPGQMLTAADLVSKYGKGLHDQNLKLLANFTVQALACGELDDQKMETTVARYAKDIAGFRSFLPGDKRFAAVDKQVTEYSRALLADYLSPEKNRMFDADGIFESLALDAPRSDYAVNGQKFMASDGTRGDGTATIKAFKSAVKPEHRKALSSFLNQMGQSCSAYMMLKAPLPKMRGIEKDMDVAASKGFDMLISGSMDDGFYAGPIGNMTRSRYQIDVAADGKSAKLVLEGEGNLTFPLAGINSKKINNVVGSYTWRQEITFDLTKNPPTIASVHIGQTIEA